MQIYINHADLPDKEQALWHSNLNFGETLNSLAFIAYMRPRRTSLCFVQCRVWWSWGLTGHWLLCRAPSLWIIKDSPSPESRHSQAKGPLWHGTGCLQPPETAPLLSGWQLVTLAIVLQPGHPSSVAPYRGSGGVGPTGRTHGGRREHSVTPDDIHRPVIGCTRTCNTSGNIGCFCSTPQLPYINFILFIFQRLASRSRRLHFHGGAQVGGRSLAEYRGDRVIIVTAEPTDKHREYSFNAVITTVCTHPLLYSHHRDVALWSPTAISRRGLCSTVVCSLGEDKPVLNHNLFTHHT